MSITTRGSWLWFPTPLGASDRFDTDEPLGAGHVQMLGSNATLACRENGLRPLWDFPFSDSIWTDLPVPLDPRSFLWDASPSEGVFAAFAGLHRVRQYGEQLAWPRVVLKARGSVPAPFTLGLILAALPAPGDPRTAILFGTTTTTSAVMTDLSITLTPRNEHFGQLAQSPRPGIGTLVPPDESGLSTQLALYVGAWCTSGNVAFKAPVSGFTLGLREPA